MTDLLDELRAANPIDATSLEIPPGLAVRALRPASTRPRRQRRLHRPLAILGAAAAVLLVILLLPGGRGGTPDLAARAYAATTGAGIIHWRTEQYGYSNGRQVDHQRSEGWAKDGVTHVVRYEVQHGNTRLVDDTQTADGRSKIYIAADDDYLSTSAPTANPANPLGSGDPFAIFRSAYRSGKLRRVGPQRYAVSLLANDPNGREAIYDLDPRTALPKTFTLNGITTNGGKRYDNTLVLRFATYERLPVTAANQAALSLLPHPGAGPKDDPAARHFAVLRGDQRPSPDAMRAILRVATQDKRFALDANGARAIRPGSYVIPGHGYICLGVGNANGFGASCVTIAQAVTHGIGTGDPASGITVVVPDGVKALRARKRGGASDTVPVRNSLATLPPGAYQWQLLR